MTAFDVMPLTRGIGGEIRGLDLREVDADMAGQVRQALSDRLVLVFRGQQLTPDQHLSFARHFGPVSPAPFGPKLDGYPDITVLDQVNPRGEGADSWHTDNTYMPEPPLGSILRCVQLPSVGGDTCFASMFAAHDALSEPIRMLISGLDAEHDVTKMFQTAARHGKTGVALDLAEIQRRWPPVCHPMVSVDTATGRRALYVNRNWTVRIPALTDRESAKLLEFLFDHVTVPDFQCRVTWEPGTVVFWDNRWVQHYATADYVERRVMHRVTVEGPRPVGPATATDHPPGERT